MEVINTGPIGQQGGACPTTLHPASPALHWDCPFKASGAVLLLTGLTAVAPSTGDVGCLQRNPALGLPEELWADQ